MGGHKCRLLKTIVHLGARDSVRVGEDGGGDEGGSNLCLSKEGMWLGCH